VKSVFNAVYCRRLREHYIYDVKPYPFPGDSSAPDIFSGAADERQALLTVNCPVRGSKFIGTPGFDFDKYQDVTVPRNDVYFSRARTDSVVPCHYGKALLLQKTMRQVFPAASGSLAGIPLADPRPVPGGVSETIQEVKHRTISADLFKLELYYLASNYKAQVVLPESPEV
jgi:hypothetical protein